MARKRVIFLYQLSPILKSFYYLLFGLFPMLLILLCQDKAELFALNTSNSEHSKAEILTQKGFKELEQGQVEAALHTWSVAYHIYQKLNDHEGIIGSLINQSLALKTSGSYLESCQTLTKALEIEDWICENPQFQQANVDAYKERLNQALQKQPALQVRVIGLKNLADLLRQMGKPDTSLLVLQKAFKMTKSLALESSNLNNELLLSQANTERVLYSQTKNKYEIIDEPIAKYKAFATAQSQINSALKLYQKLAIEQQSIAALPAQLNQLNLLLELEKWPAEAEINLQPRRQLVRDLVKKLLATPDQFQRLPAIDSIYAQLNLANSLGEISQNTQINQLLFTSKKNSLEIALSTAQKALSLAQKLDNERAESYALGTIGNIYSLLGQSFKSKQYLEQAMALAQALQAWDIAYQWQQQLGKFYQQNQDFHKATQAYAAAISSLEQVRGNILSVNPDLQFAFKDKVEPVYQEYINLLLSQVNPDLKQVIKVHEQLKLAELQNFLQCGKLPIFSGNEKQNSVKLPPIIYLIRTGGRIEEIVQTPQGNLYRHSIDLKLVNEPVNSLLKLVQNGQFYQAKNSDFLSYSQSLYQQLFAPIKKYLPESGTLVFVLDSYFQNLPLDLLHNGKKYLIESYSISISVSSHFLPSQALKPDRIEALIAGISQISPSFKDLLAPKNLNSLPQVIAEIANIKQNTKTVSLLLNQEFTDNNFRQKIKDDSFPIVHITTHGQFSSDPDQTFIMAWDHLINVRELNFLLRKHNERSVIDLLVLSACQTAKGDRRSALGIAGIAAEAGARSTLATLWLVDANSTAIFMGEFYKGLKNGLSKAEALRFAQLTLLSNPKYTSPYYWGAFVLVGAWN